MLIIVHVGIALSSMILAAFALFYPSLSRLRLTYALIALTFATGTALVFLDSSKLPQVCTTGVLYLVVMLVGVAVIRRRLAASI